MDNRGLYFILAVVLLLLITACTTQPEKIVGTVIVQITATPLPTLEPTPTEVPTEIPTEVPTETQEQILGNAPACIPPNTEISLGVVTEVVDGDTIKAIIDGETYTVRYIGIDTPETKDPNQTIQYMGPEATAKNLDLVMGEVISLVKDVSETDQYDRLLRYVFIGDLDGIFVNHEMVRSGYAAVDTYPPDVACSEYFLQAQQEARTNNLGLWGATPIPPTPIPPTPVPPTAVPPTPIPPTPIPPTQPPPPPPTSTPSAANCHSSYPDFCIPPPPPDLDCGDISRKRFTVLPPDPHRFDGDNDGVGCES